MDVVATLFNIEYNADIVLIEIVFFLYFCLNNFKCKCLLICTSASSRIR